MARTREPRHQHQMSHIDMSTKKTKGAEEHDVRKSAQPRKTAQLIKIVAVAVAVAVVVAVAVAVAVAVVVEEVVVVG